MSDECCPIIYIQVAHFPKPRSNFRWEYTTQTSHHVQAQVGQSSVFHLTILTPTRNTNQQTAHDTNPWVFFFRLSLLFALTSMNSESARVAKVLLFPLLQRKIQTVDSEFARHCAASHWSLIMISRNETSANSLVQVTTRYTRIDAVSVSISPWKILNWEDFRIQKTWQISS